MSDLLVKLYDLPPLQPPLPASYGVSIRRARAPEREAVLDFVRDTFGNGWRGECAVSFGGHPISCFIAAEGTRPVGFACYDATFRGFFGPLGVAKSSRGKGIGTALTQACLLAMRDAGYAYAIIGATKIPDFYRTIAGATEIPDSHPGPYANLIKPSP